MECQFCEQTCSGKYNLKVRPKRKYDGLSQPVGLSKTREDQCETETACRINSNNHHSVLRIQEDRISQQIQPGKVFFKTSWNDTIYRWLMDVTFRFMRRRMVSVSYTHLTLPTICSV